MDRTNILAIETSCDDTAISVVSARVEKNKLKKFEVVSNVVSSQVEIHARYGGVYPMLAKREHAKNLPSVFETATKKTRMVSVDFIGVTAGPGLDPCLWTGINFVQGLAKKYGKPVVPINHIEAHILANFLGLDLSGEKFAKSHLPAVCLAVSGGHTILFLMKAIGGYKLLGDTRDDAAGECFDKTARILGLGYPGGPIIAELAKKWKKGKAARGLTSGKSPEVRPLEKLVIRLPRPMINQKNFDFSFSGLKTAVLYFHEKQTLAVARSAEYLEAMSYEIEQAVIDVLVSKTMRAAETFGVKAVVIGGGVSANEELRKQMKAAAAKQKLKFLAPKPEFCTDNAAMVAVAAYFAFRRGEAVGDPEQLASNPNWLI